MSSVMSSSNGSNLENTEIKEESAPVLSGLEQAPDQVVQDRENQDDLIIEQIKSASSLVNDNMQNFHSREMKPANLMLSHQDQEIQNQGIQDHEEHGHEMPDQEINEEIQDPEIGVHEDDEVIFEQMIGNLPTDDQRREMKAALLTEQLERAQQNQEDQNQGYQNLEYQDGQFQNQEVHQEIQNQEGHHEYQNQGYYNPQNQDFQNQDEAIELHEDMFEYDNHEERLQKWKEAREYHYRMYLKAIEQINIIKEEIARENVPLPRVQDDDDAQPAAAVIAAAPAPASTPASIPTASTTTTRKRKAPATRRTPTKKRKTTVAPKKKSTTPTTTAAAPKKNAPKKKKTATTRSTASSSTAPRSTPSRSTTAPSTTPATPFDPKSVYLFKDGHFYSLNKDNGGSYHWACSAKYKNCNGRLNTNSSVVTTINSTTPHECGEVPASLMKECGLNRTVRGKVYMVSREKGMLPIREYTKTLPNFAK